MSGPVVKLINGGGVRFLCPGCKDWHATDNRWVFDGDVEKPTLSPSVLVRSGHFISDYKEGDGCWCKYNAEHPNDKASFHCYLCHSFVRQGKIEFLEDCSHALAGQTVDLPPMEDWP